MGAQKFLIQREQGIFFERGRFERVIKFRGGGGEAAGLQQLNQLQRTPRPAIERGGKARQVLIGPRGGNAEAGMDQQKRRAAQRGKWFAGNQLLAPSRGERGKVLQEEWNVRTERRRQRVKPVARQRAAEKFVQRQQGGGRVAAASAQTGGLRNSLFEMDANAVRNAGFAEKRFRRAMHEIAGIHRQGGVGAGQ